MGCSDPVGHRREELDPSWGIAALLFNLSHEGGGDCRCEGVDARRTARVISRPVNSMKKVSEMRRGNKRLWMAGAMGAFLAFALTATSAQAATVTVNTTTVNSSTDGKCGFVEAVQAINQQSTYRNCTYTANGQSDRIIFSVNGTHTFSGVSLQRSVEIKGNGASATVLNVTGAGGISASGLSSGNTQSILLRDLKLQSTTNNWYSFGVVTYNKVKVSTRNATITGFGIGLYLTGALANADLESSTVENNHQGMLVSGGSMKVSSCTFRNNTSGGALLYNYAASSVSYVMDSLFENNTGANGGGLHVSAQSDPNYYTSTLYIERTTFRNNNATNNGGGLYATASVSILESTFDGNSATNIGGGFIAHERSSYDSVMVNVEKSTFTNNTANHGGGYANYGPSEGQRVKATLKQSTFGPDNTAWGDGGGIYSVSQIDWAENLTIYKNQAKRGGGLFHDSGGESHVFHSTITNNTATQSNGGAGLWLQTGNPLYSYNIIAGNKIGTLTRNVYTTNPSLNAQYNLLDSVNGIPAGVFSGGTNILGDPRLDPFGSYGGPTKTRRPKSDSPAIDAILSYDSTSQDQRGQSRPLDGDHDGVARHDIGAVEYEL